MTLRTITYDDAEWQVVPKQMTEPMRDRFHEDIRILCDPQERTANVQNDLYVWSQVLATAPEPPAQQPTEMDDTQRLDHLIQTGAFRVFSLDMGGKHTWTGIGRSIGKGPTVRDAIDDSIKRHHDIGKGESDAG